ncbi:MAG: CDP-alcohol phosphatidyltransferase family protein [Candidatus Aenigmarchaeota archaeon]|nr:CDP-alcohol phosphatidyltransferase family protein [Candidatus Aenigmarchaeota archaeon]
MIKSKRPTFIECVEKITGSVFSKMPVTPNQWTLLSLVLAVTGFAFSAVYKDLGKSLALFFAAFAIDYVDGAVARYTRKTTRKGAYIDGVSDRFVEAFIMVGLMFYELPNVLLDSKIALAVLLFLSTMTSYTRAYADHKKIVTGADKLRSMGGLLERFERVSILLISVAISFYYGTWVISYVVLSLILLSFVTVMQRILYSVKEAGR